MKYKHFKLLSFEEQKEYRHEQEKYFQNILLILLCFFLNFQNWLLGYTGVYALFTIFIIIVSFWLVVVLINVEDKFKTIAKKKEKAIKEL